MDQQNEFAYTYSAPENQQIQHIRSKYLPRQETKLETLKKLDHKVKGPANAFAYTFGSIAAIIMGAGMSLVMTDVGTMLGMTETMAPGIAVGIVGMVMALINYPIHKGMLRARRKKYAPQILELSEELLQG